MLSPERLETYMRRAAMLGRETVEVPPFVCFFSPGDPLRFFNYAKPLRPVGAEPDSLTDALWLPCELRFRRARACRVFEFIEEYAPDLGPALVAAGFGLEERYPLLVCTPETLRPSSAHPRPDDHDADARLARGGPSGVPDRSAARASAKSPAIPRRRSMSMICARIWPRMGLSWREWRVFPRVR